jgi:hypothetical protein
MTKLETLDGLVRICLAQSVIAEPPTIDDFPHKIWPTSCV